MRINIQEYKKLYPALDDSDAINQAIDEICLSSNGGGIIYLPAAVYLLTNAIVINQKGIILEGEGIDYGGGTNGTLIKVGAGINGFEIKPSYDILSDYVSPVSGIKYKINRLKTQATYCSIKNLQIVEDESLPTHGTSLNGIAIFETPNVLIENVVILNMGANGVFITDDKYDKTLMTSVTDDPMDQTPHNCNSWKVIN